MKLNRKHLTTLVATLLLATLTHSASAYDFMVDGLCYYIYTDNSEKKVGVTRQLTTSPSYANLSGEVTIPATVTHYGVTYKVIRIEVSAFWGCKNITSVSIPSSVVDISQYAFSGCSGLKDVTIGNSVKEIDNSAFSGCSGLTSVTIPNSVTSIGSYAFEYCSSLTSITIGNSVTSIGEYAFQDCSDLTSLTIGNSVKSIGNYAFRGCTGLTSMVVQSGNTVYDSRDNCNAIVKTASNSLIAGCKNTVIPNSVTSIGNNAFQGCKGLTSVTIPNSVTSIGNYAFDKCNGLTSVTIGNSVTSIGSNAFSGCSGLTSVTIPNSVTTIGQQAFYSCSGLTSVTIGNSVTSIGNSTFSGCTDLTSMVVKSNNTVYDSRDNCNAIVKTASNTLIVGCKNTVIPNSVTSIGSNAFFGCSGLTSVTIPNSVTKIGEYAFSGCSGLKTVNWNAKSCADFTSTASSQPFKGLSITTINFGNEVEKIPAYLCYGLTGLTSVTIGNSVTTIGTYAFSGCSGLKTVNWNIKSHADFSSTASSRPFNGLTSITTFNFGNGVEKIPAYLCYGLSGLTSVTIPSSVSTIGNNTFGNCNGIKTLTWNAIQCGSMGNMPTSKIETVTIGDNVQLLPEFFVTNSKITTITIPNSVTTISRNAFQSCLGLTSVTIPNSVTSIGSNAFYGCSGLTSITIPKSVTFVENGAFSNCSGLKTVNWNVKSQNGYNSTSSGPFYNSTGITSFTFGNEVEEIPAYICYGITGLSSVTIPNSLTTIGNGAFYGCSGLTSVTIPNSVTSIGSGAFSSCSGLKYVICKPTTPPTITNSNTFSSSIPILIPTGTMTTYKNANYWKNYNLRYTLTKITPYRTHATIVSEDKEISHLVKVKLNNKEYSVSNDSILIDGLQPRNYNEYENNHTAVAFCKVLGEDRVDTIQFRTMPLNFIEMSGSSTQSTITPKFKVDRADEHGIKISITSSGASYGYPSKDYSGRIIEETDDYYVIETVPITGLTPNSKIYYIPWVTCNGKKCEGPQYNITTQNIGTSSNVTTGPTNVEMTGSYNAGDATVKDAYFTFNGQQMKKIVMTGLRPSTTYSTVYTVVTNNGKINTNMSFTTKSLTMTTQEARMLSDTSPMLIAETNMADVETSCGFEWRRYDAPEEMPSAKVYCPVYGGTMAGVLKNMSPNVYYKYRPFYKASDGNEYYGNWIAFITADAGVTFEPVVYTYKAPEVTQNTATLQGVALPGSSEITEQGFEYWRMNGSKAPTGTVNKVTATGQRMSATVQGLNAGATYGYRSYVKAGGQTYYGSEEQFTTEKPTGDVNGDSAVNVSDVTTLVNMILGVIPKDNTRADIDGNGTVNVSDVTALVNLILGIH